MTSNAVILSRQQAGEVFNALRGINELLKGLEPKSGNRAELYAVMSNLAVIQMNFSGAPPGASN
jgi:hypothetical protein